MSIWTRLEKVVLDDSPRPTSVCFGPNRGSRLVLNRARQTKLWIGSYEYRVQSEMTDRYARAWDIGAHVGFFSVLLAKHADEVIAVEPNPENVDRLRQAVEMNRAAITVIEAAVSSRDGSGRLARGLNPYEWHLSDSGLPVRTVTLDTLLDDFGAPTIVKLDIEGAEVDALRGGRRVLELRPKLVIETHGVRVEEQVRAMLRAHGYRVRRAANSIVAI